MKSILSLILFFCLGKASLFSQQRFTGTVSNPEGEVLSGASVRLLGAGLATATDDNGQFSLPSPQGADTLLISYMGYVPSRLYVEAEAIGPLHITLQADPNALQEVIVNTGYYEVPQERATGAFTHVDNELLNRSVSTNILDRLEGVTNSLLFDRRNLEAEDVNGQPELRVRGLSTIESDSRPLIVVDNFPYEGDISTINPNDVESITLLRDAAAASIWGARAGNGVIVINTKQGAYNQAARISFNGNVNIIEKPDLFYSPNFLPSPTVMEIQKELFERGVYPENEFTYIPSYVELLIKQRDGMISGDEFDRQETFMLGNDLRRDWYDHLYQPAVNQQYAVGVRGGGGHYRYAFSAGYDRNTANIVGNGNERINLSLQNTFRMRPSLELAGSIWYSTRSVRENGMGYQKLADVYESFVNVDGMPNHVGRGYRLLYQEQSEDYGLLDWMYRPLDEVRLASNTAGNDELRFNGNINYNMFRDLSFHVAYQYTLGRATSQNIFHRDSYEVRNLVNRFTQADGTRIIPHGGIVEFGVPRRMDTHSGRSQLNYNRSFDGSHDISTLLGVEIRQAVNISGTGSRHYDYDPDTWRSNPRMDFVTRFPTRPSGTSQVGMGAYEPNKATNRYLSYFGNASYSYKKRYILSGSLRWDGSNLLGVKTNQRGTALWSLGGSWDLSEEQFYRSDWIPYLRLRTTFGSAGNIDKSQSHYPTINITTNAMTGLAQANLVHPGNSSLRWEQVNTFNAGLDWRLLNNRISGSFEFYNKHAKYLLGDNMVDPSAGVSGNYKMNYANLRTQGWDVSVSSRNLVGSFRWNTVFLFNYSYNRITQIFAPDPPYDFRYVTTNIHERGVSVDKLYALPWYGLNPETGFPLIYIDGQVSNDYVSYYQNISKENLVSVGVTVPPSFGSVRNIFEWKGFQMSALVSFKTGYIFRRSSISPGQEYVVSTPVYHKDYFSRWEQPGDELSTDVPAWAHSNEANLSNTYLYSEALITKGDAIRLQDVNLSYTLRGNMVQRWPVQHIRLYAYARNMGILWRANDTGIDPDYPNADYPAPKSFALGLQVEF